MAEVGRVLIYGGRGALGAKCITHFKANNFVRLKILCCHDEFNFALFFQWVANIDLAENSEADVNIIVNTEDNFQQQVPNKLFN